MEKQSGEKDVVGFRLWIDLHVCVCVCVCVCLYFSFSLLVWICGVGSVQKKYLAKSHILHDMR